MSMALPPEWAGPQASVAREFASLAARGKVMAEYIWIGGTGVDLHSKTRILESVPAGPQDLPVWHFDGSATGQVGLRHSVVYMKPKAIYPDPLRGGDHILVLCDTYTPPQFERDGVVSQLEPHSTNNRSPCETVMRAASCSDPVFSVEQQFTLLDPRTKRPLGWPEDSGVPQSKPTYCSLGTGLVAGRDVSEAHLRACLHAGLNISGSNAESVPGQWSYSIGPCRGIELGDQLWVSRYLLDRVAEHCQVIASIDPKPVPGDWAGNGASVKFSTRETREEGKGWYAILGQIRRLEFAHMQHIMTYGTGNDKRLTGQHQTSSVLQFTYGVENRSASILIPHSVLINRRGYYEDRRPAANMDPYLVTMMLVCTTSGIPLPVHPPVDSTAAAAESESESEELSRGSSAILDELAEQESDSLMPDTPPQNPGLLACECSSQNYP